MLEVGDEFSNCIYNICFGKILAFKESLELLARDLNLVAFHKLQCGNDPDWDEIFFVHAHCFSCIRRLIDRQEVPTSGLSFVFPMIKIPYPR